MSRWYLLLVITMTKSMGINQMGRRDDTPVKKCVLTIKNTRRRFMNKRNLLSILLVFLTPIVIFGQSISGTISGDGKPLVGLTL